MCHLEIDKDAWINDEELMARAMHAAEKKTDESEVEIEPVGLKAAVVPRIQECWLQLQPTCEMFQR